MPTLITLTLENRTVHTCDERCYNSTADESICICHGRNHGQGIVQAERNSIIDAGEIVDDCHHHHPNFKTLTFHFYNTDFRKALIERDRFEADYRRNHPLPDHQPLAPQQDSDPTLKPTHHH